MKIHELFHLDKALAEKKKELEELKLTLEVINQENSEDLIDINYVYVFKPSNSDTKYFCYRVRNNYPNHNIELIDVFSNTKRKEYHDIIEYAFSEDEMTYIKDVLPEVNVYPSGKVPRILLQRLYYRENHINKKVLKRVMKNGK